MNELHSHIEEEVRNAETAERSGDLPLAFSHLERAHLLARSLTEGDTRVPWLMLKLAVKMRSYREICGQFIRLVGAAAKTQFGEFPAGETVRLDISSFERMTGTNDLHAIPTHVKVAVRQPPARAAIRDQFETGPSVGEIEKLAMSLSASERSELASRLLRSVPSNGAETEEPAKRKQQEPEPDSPLGGVFTIEELERRIAERFRA